MLGHYKGVETEAGRGYLYYQNVAFLETGCGPDLVLLGQVHCHGTLLPDPHGLFHVVSLSPDCPLSSPFHAPVTRPVALKPLGLGVPGFSGYPCSHVPPLALRALQTVGCLLRLVAPRHPLAWWTCPSLAHPLACVLAPSARSSHS